MRRSHFAVLASLLAAIIFVGLNLASWKWLAPVRVDFTQNGLYTLSSSARRVVERLVEPVELELVYSRGRGANFPAIRAHADRVRELMNEIAARSGGKVRVRETDPEPFSDDEDRITAAGLSAVPTDGGDPIYLGVIGHNSVDDAIAIPYLSPDRDALLEYDLVRLIAQLDNPEPPKVAVISSLPAYQGDGTGEGDAFVLREMRRAFTVIPVDQNFRALPPGTNVLMIVHPGPLNEWQQYVIDQFLLRKGRALIALDPVSRVSLAQQGRRAIPSSNLGRLGETLGVTVASDVAVDRVLGLPVEVDAGAGRRNIESQPLFPAVPRALLSRTDPITADLSRAINFGAPGHLVVTPVAGLAFTNLAETTSEAGLASSELAMSDPTPRKVLESYKKAGAQILAGRLSGRLTSAFDHPPAPPVEEDPVVSAVAQKEVARVEPYVSRSDITAQIVFVADSDVFDDGFYVNPNNNTPIADNAAFILNALDNLGGDEALTALRSRAPAARPMERVDAMRAQARARLYSEQERLEKGLAEAESRLKQLEARRVDGAARTPEEIAEIAAYRDRAATTRKQLRNVEREFRRDIDALAGSLEFLNVWLPPLFVGVLGVGVFLWRSRRRAVKT
ncbi:MAG TPA: Gldg family protein [Hyphomonadaceae bacterium]|nr:Gldg family protein [Hyphomonadaceae bacterium]